MQTYGLAYAVYPQGGFPVSVGTPTEFRVTRASNVSDEIDEIGCFRTSVNLIGPGWTSKPCSSLIGYFQHTHMGSGDGRLDLRGARILVRAVDQHLLPQKFGLITA